MKSLWVGAAVASCALFAPRSEACSGGQAPPAFAIPRTGSTDVSTASSLVVFSGTEPSQVELTAAGQPLVFGKVEELGFTVTGAMSYTKVWQVKVPGFLTPSAEHVLSVLDTVDAGVTGRVELTRFTTAAGYDKALGTAAKPRSLELWRVRYPLSEILSGNCVFAEYRGYIRIDYDPASIPNTTPAATVYDISVAPKTGGAAQTFYFTGDDLFKGTSPESDPHALDRWQQLELDPSREYCATITAFGDGDLARLPVVSETICAPVGQLASFDAGSAPTTMPDAASSPDAPAGTVGGDIVGTPPSSTGVSSTSGCSCTLTDNPPSNVKGLGVVTLLALALLRRSAPS